MAPQRLLLPVRPMLATAGPLPAAAGWASEFKWDGLRAVVYLDGAAARAWSRNGLDITDQFPELAALDHLAHRGIILDGEIVALDEAGVAQFARLQSRMHVRSPAPSLVRRTPATYYPFDVLAYDHRSTTTMAYQLRRELLGTLKLERTGVQVPPAFLDAEPADVYEAAVDAGLEGVVCKRLISAYQPGRRSRDWIKVPIALSQEVVVIGWQGGNGRRADTIGALLLAVHGPSGDLAYVGKVGTGFTDAALRSLATVLAPLSADTSSAPDVPRADARGAHWVRPTLVGEVVFRNWTPSRRLRHVSWRGLRPDKDPDRVYAPPLAI